MKHVLNLSDLGPGGLRRVLDHARARKTARRGLPHQAGDIRDVGIDIVRKGELQRGDGDFGHAPACRG